MARAAQLATLVVVCQALWMSKLDASTIDPMTPVTVQENDDFNITCTATLTVQVEGVRLQREEGNGQKTIFQVIPSVPEELPDPNKYLVEKLGDSNFRVTVKTAQFDDAVKYTCSLVVDANVQQTAFVVVVRKPQIQAKRTYMAEEDAVLHCEVSYAKPTQLLAENPGFPKLRATLGNVEQPGTTELPHEGKTKMTWNMTMKESYDQKDLLCTVFTTTPSFELDAVHVLNVNYKVRTVTIMPKESQYMVGQVVNCSADGNPAPDITWIPQETKSPNSAQGTELTISPNMVGEPLEKWRCSAVNVIPGTDNIPVVDEIVFSVVRPTKPPTGENKQETPTAAIAAGVTIPLVLIICAVIVAIIVIRRRRRPTSGKSNPDLVTNNLPPLVRNDLKAKGGDGGGDDGGGGGSRSPLSAEPRSKPNSNGRNVQIAETPPTRVGDGDEADVGRRALTPLDEMASGPTHPPPRGYTQLDRRYPGVPVFPDMIAAHPGLQKALSRDQPPPLTSAPPPEENYHPSQVKYKPEPAVRSGRPTPMTATHDTEV